LRAAGTRPDTVRRAYLTEAAILAAIVLVTATVTAVATTVPLLTAMRLVGGWAPAPILHPSIRWTTLAAVVVGVAAVAASLCAVMFTRFGRAARPASLRAADR
jgi:glucose uptake protein GlcU